MTGLSLDGTPTALYESIEKYLPETTELMVALRIQDGSNIIVGFSKIDAEVLCLMERVQSWAIDSQLNRNGQKNMDI